MAEHGPDIVADASDLSMIPDGAAEELYASHVLEHFAFPRTVLVLAEWARVLAPGGTLKVAVPDMALVCALIAEGRSSYTAMHQIYGGHWATPGGPQGHHYGFTCAMLVELLTLLGFGELDWWNSEMQEAANGWIYGENGERLGISLNIVGRKLSRPKVDPAVLAERLRHRIPDNLMEVAREIGLEAPDGPPPDPLLFQRLHFKLIEERQKVKWFEEERTRLLAEIERLRGKG